MPQTSPDQTCLNKAGTQSPYTGLIAHNDFASNRPVPRDTPARGTVSRTGHLTAPSTAAHQPVGAGAGPAAPHREAVDKAALREQALAGIGACFY